MAKDLTPHDVQRLDQMRRFMRAHGLTYADIAEQFEDVAQALGEDPSGEGVDYYAAQSMLRCKTLRKAYRDRLLDLDFPAEALPVERPDVDHAATA